MDAINAPIRRPRKETLSADFPISQPSSIDLPDEGDIDRDQVIVHADADIMEREYTANLAFNEEPVTIMIYPGREKNPAMVVPCWNNGKGAEVLINGKWVEANCLPVNMPVTTKRKYVEVLTMSRTEQVETDVGDATMENPHNRLRRMQSANTVFSVMEDKSPKSAEWLRRVMGRTL